MKFRLRALQSLLWRHRFRVCGRLRCAVKLGRRRKRARIALSHAAQYQRANVLQVFRLMARQQTDRRIIQFDDELLAVSLSTRIAS